MVKIQLRREHKIAFIEQFKTQFRGFQISNINFIQGKWLKTCE